VSNSALSKSALSNSAASSSVHVLSPGPRQAFHRRSLHPLHSMLLGAASSFLVSGFLSDWAYAGSTEIQWKNFAGWLIIGGLVFTGFALLWMLVDLVRLPLGRGPRIVAFVLLLAAFVLGIVDELVHAKDAWASMPEALILSGVVAVLAIAATAVGSAAPAGGR
jgi:uncharacterized membrane protein